MTCIVSLITESSLHTKDGHIDLIASLNIVWSLQKHATEIQTHYTSSFFLLLVAMAGLEGELGTLLRVDMAGLPLFGVNFFAMALFFLCCTTFVCCSLDPEGPS